MSGDAKKLEASMHRTDRTRIEDVQSANQQWWTDHTMSYDWSYSVAAEKYSLDWFREIDERFIRDARLFGHDKAPFDRLIPFDTLRDKDVLEIGCGMGLHSELLVRAGARVTSLDLSATSVEATTRRMAVKGLTATVRQGDAESLPFDDGSFDYVWSWGVIHHSSRTARIAREIARVLRPGGRCGIMVYHRHGGSAKLAILKYHWLRLGFLRRSVEESLNVGCDGYHARFYVPDQFEDVFRAFFRDVRSEICGQEVDSLMLPRRIRNVARRFVTDRWLTAAQKKRGSFLVLHAANPQ